MSLETVPESLHAVCSNGSSNGVNPAILLAEDDEDDALLFLRTCKQTAPLAEVLWFESGDFLVGYLASLPEMDQPALVVLDLKMPRMDGFEVLKWMRSQPRWEKIPIVVFSSSDLPADRAKAQQLGASCYYQKPVTFRQYEETLARMLTQCLPAF